jgi:hypothetical protein
MSMKPTSHHCHSCPANWSKGQWTPECPECGGGPLEIDCIFCQGRCGAKWQKAVIDSHDCAQAHWFGNCLLSEEEKDEISELGLQEFARRQRARTWRGKMSAAKPVWGFMALLVLVGLMALKMDNIRGRQDGHPDEVAQEVHQHQRDGANEAGRKLNDREDTASKASPSKESAVEAGKPAAKSTQGTRQDSGQGTGAPDTTGVKKLDLDAFHLENMGQD